MLDMSQGKVRFYVFATDRSKELVKKLYYAMKCEKVFYKFTKSFLPLRGLTTRDETIIQEKQSRTNDEIVIKDIIYRPVLYGEERRRKMPNVLLELEMINNMLSYRNSVEQRYNDKSNTQITKKDVYSHYVDYYFSKHKKNRPCDMMVKFMFGTIGVLLFTILLFLGICLLISKAIAIVFGFFIMFLTLIVMMKFK